MRKNRLIRVTDRLQVAAPPADKPLAERNVITFRRKDWGKKREGTDHNALISCITTQCSCTGRAQVGSCRALRTEKRIKSEAIRKEFLHFRASETRLSYDERQAEQLGANDG